MQVAYEPLRYPFFIPSNRILRHILFWVWVYAMDVLIFGIGYERVNHFLKIALLEMPGQVLLAYLFMYWIIPRHLAKKNSLETFGFAFFTFVAAGFITHLFFIGFSAYEPQAAVIDVPKIMMRGFYSFLQGFIAIGVKLALLWYDNERRMEYMERNKLQAELKMLKDQVNPHFMFNTLNNLYGLISRNPTHAQESVLRLSGILHFMLHESNHPAIPVQLEIKCIQDYVELEKLRYTESLSISLNVAPYVRELAIAPLTIFPFVENSFKHGASELIQEAWVNMDFSVYKNNFVFKIENSKRPRPVTSSSKGIGLTNVKRRLELIYGEDHSLQIIDSDESFLVILKIALTRMKQTEVESHEAEMSYR
jgi:two-component system LytT family sensor kinase